MSKSQELMKDKLKNIEQVNGMHITLPDPRVTELCGSIGYDFLWIDTEHSTIDYESLEMLLIAAKAAGSNTLVRIPWNDQILAKRVLEMGPEGIIFPMINTAKELDAAMESTLYPPLGIRGFGPRRAVNYGLDNEKEYIEKGSLDLIRCVQIETFTAVENLEIMAQNPWVDCFIFGLNDLSASIGELPNIYNDGTQKLVDQAIRILRKAKKSIGISISTEDPKIIEFWKNKGVTFFSVGTDISSIITGTKNILNILKNS